MKTKILPSLIAIAGLILLAAFFPPGRFTWTRFLADPAPLTGKLIFLFKAYALPAVLSFTAVLLFQFQMRISVVGAPAYVVFPLSLLGASAMLSAFRTMAVGVGGIPGYVFGLATAYTLMSRFAGLRRTGRYVLGVETLRIVWRGEIAALRERPVAGPALERRAG